MTGASHQPTAATARPFTKAPMEAMLFENETRRNPGVKKDPWSVLHWTVIYPCRRETRAENCAWKKRESERAAYDEQRPNLKGILSLEPVPHTAESRRER